MNPTIELILITCVSLFISLLAISARTDFSGNFVYFDFSWFINGLKLIWDWWTELRLKEDDKFDYLTLVFYFSLGVIAYFILGSILEGWYRT